MLDCSNKVAFWIEESPERSVAHDEEVGTRPVVIVMRPKPKRARSECARVLNSAEIACSLLQVALFLTTKLSEMQVHEDVLPHVALQGHASRHSASGRIRQAAHPLVHARGWHPAGK